VILFLIKVAFPLNIESKRRRMYGDSWLQFPSPCFASCPMFWSGMVAVPIVPTDGGASKHFFGILDKVIDREIQRLFLKRPASSPKLLISAVSQPMCRFAKRLCADPEMDFAFRPFPKCIPVGRIDQSQILQ
jgi:hypothetical protein